MLPLLLALLLSPGSIADELSRLEGHRVIETAGGYEIIDVAGEGAPIVGVVEKRDDGPWLAGYRLIGPLARPRIAGPGYKVWALGDVAGDTLRVRRLGVLAPPRAQPGAEPGAQDDARDLGGGADAHGRTPEPAAAARVELRRADALVTDQMPALGPHRDVVPRPDLAAVRVPRDLQPDAVRRGLVDVPRLVRE
jgi:hypothetical protein